jgi:acetyl esterase/lipase
MTKFMCLLSLVTVLAGAHASALPVGYPSTDSNVRYKQVTDLGFKPATKKLVYGEDDPGLQYGMLWLPEDVEPEEKSPLVVLIHGGCWLNAFDIEHTYPLSTALAQAGYAVWSLEYRRTGDKGGGWPGTFEDIKTGLAFTSKLRGYPVDLNRVVVAGHSAGGHLALLAGGEFQNLKAVIGLAAITDIVEYSQGTNSCQTATLEFMNGDYQANPEAYQLANPVGKKLHPNTVLLHGDIDAIVPVHQSTLLETKSDVLTGAGHFDWVHPGTPAYQRFLSTLNEVLDQ